MKPTPSTSSASSKEASHLPAKTPGLKFISRKGAEIGRFNWQCLLRCDDYTRVIETRLSNGIIVEAFWHGVVHECERRPTPFGLRVYQKIGDNKVDLSAWQWYSTEAEVRSKQMTICRDLR